jgi:hypothetical protein
MKATFLVQASVLSFVLGCNSSRTPPASVPSPEPSAAQGVLSGGVPESALRAADKASGMVWTKKYSDLHLPEKGTRSVVRLPDGGIVAAVSYAFDDKPFVVYTGKPSALQERIPPWSCAASPAELNAVGETIWMHCGDPHSPDDTYRVHIWFSTNGGLDWTRAGSYGGGVFGLSFAQDVAYLNGEFDGKSATLHRVQAGAKGATRTQAEDEFSPNLGKALASFNLRTIASRDGTIAVVFSTVKTDTGKTSLVILGSLDGGKTLKKLYSVPFEEKYRVEHPSLADGILRIPFEVQHEQGGSSAVGLATFSLRPQADPKIIWFDAPAESVCVYGSQVVAQWSEASFGVSFDGGETFVSLTTPNGETEHGFLRCSAEGVSFGNTFAAWPEGD